MKDTKHVERGIWASAMLAVIVLGFVAGGSLFAAETEGDFTYTVTDDEATITDYDGSGPEDVVIPVNLGGYPVTAIGAEAFEDKGLTAVSIPYNVVEIGERAFKDNLLETVWIPDGVSVMGQEAFAGNQLIYANIPEEMTEIKANAFSGNDLETMTIPDGVTDIGNEAFKDNAITTITIPDSVTTIGSDIFFGNQVDPGDLTIYGAIDSEAHTYAVANDHTFGRLMEPDMDAPDEWESHANYLDEEFENSMQLFVEVEDVNADNSSLAVFKGSVIRGWGEIIEYNGVDLFMLLVWSDETEEEGLVFRVYAAGDDKVYDINENLDFAADESFGTAYDDTELLTLLDEEEDTEGTQTVELSTGWNWVSFDTLPENKSINNALEDYDGTPGDIIRTAEGSATYWHDGNWYGTLTEIHFGVGYQIHAQTGGELNVVGAEVDADVEPTELVEGWNWIGYYGSHAEDVQVALGDSGFWTGDIIKGSEFAAFDGGATKEWYGPLDKLEPGKAYMLKVKEAGEIEFIDQID